MILFKVRILNATEDSEIEKKRIPKVYSRGLILGKYFAIVMTFFDETLGARFEQQNKQLSETTFLSIFKQAVGSYGILMLLCLINRGFVPV